MFDKKYSKILKTIPIISTGENDINSKDLNLKVDKTGLLQSKNMNQNAGL